MPARRRTSRAVPAIPAAEVVDALYQGLLDRPAEPEGLEHHLRLLGEGRPLAEVVHGVGHSREYFELWLRGGDLPDLLAAAWGSSRSRTEPPLYFLHIMKTGGTSLVSGLTAAARGRFCLTQIFLDHLVAVPPPLLRLASLVSGHLGAMAFDAMPAGTVTATVIRDPLDRVLSHYAHVLGDPGQDPAETAGLSLESFVHSPRWRPYVENFQARNLVKRVDLSAVWRDHSPDELLATLDPAVRPRESQLPLQSYFELSPMAMPEAGIRAAALARLATAEHVGVTDRLDLLVAHLAERWGTEAPGPVPRANVSTGRPAPDHVGRRLREEILEANAVDLALYEEAQARSDADARASRRAVHVMAGARTAAGGQGPASVAGPGHAPVAPAASVTPRGPATAVSWASRWALAVALLVTVAITVIDVSLPHVALAGLLAVAPCAALPTARWQAVGAVGVLSVVLATVLGVPDGIWGTSDQLLAVGTVAGVAAFLTAAAAVLGPVGAEGADATEGAGAPAPG